MHRFSKEGVNAHPMAKAKTRRGARVVEEARLESVYTPKGYHEFESRSITKEKFNILKQRYFEDFFDLCVPCI